MAEKNLYVGYSEESDELIITSDPKAKTAGFFIDSGVAVLVGIKDMRPRGLSFILLKDYFKKHPKKAFAKIPLVGNVALSNRILASLPQPKKVK